MKYTLHTHSEPYPGTDSTIMARVWRTHYTEGLEHMIKYRQNGMYYLIDPQDIFLCCGRCICLINARRD